MKIRLTQKRRQLLDTLKQQPCAISAASLHQLLPDIDLVTIYRNLDLFVQEKLIKKIRLDSDEALYEYQSEPHWHAICTDCAKVRHFTAPDSKIKQLLALKDFAIEEIEVTVKGVCCHRP